MASQDYARAGDFAAISLSGLCMVHCLALPLAAALLPAVGSWACCGFCKTTRRFLPRLAS